jgi:hypothetical protein
MTVSQELVWLINQIRNTPSSLERLRLLALGWRTLRGLSPADRLAVARELGFDGAEQLVEQLAKRGGASPSLLLQGLDSLEAADPDQVSGLVRGLTDPDRRADTAERLVDLAADWLSGEAADPEVAEVGQIGEEGEPPGPEDHVSEVQPPPPPPPPAVVEVEPPPEVAPKEELHADEIEEIEVGEEETADDERSVPTVDEVEAPEPPQVATERPEIPAPVVEAPQDPPEEESVALPAALVESVAARLAAVTSTTARFRVLAEVVDELEDAGAHHLVPVVDTFPEGWARRRAIETLLRAGIPGQLGAALELVSKLERPSDRMWALSTLAASRELDQNEREEIIAAAESPSIERRLRMRLAP